MAERQRIWIALVLCLAFGVWATSGIVNALGIEQTKPIFLPFVCSERDYEVIDRLGVCSAYGTPQDYPLTGMYGLWSDYLFRAAPPAVGNAEYAQMILVRALSYPPDWEQVRETADQNPGSLWIIGNEPECINGQGARTPEEYAVIYHDCYSFLKESDPTARVAVGGVVEPTPLRLEWLDRCLEHYVDTYYQSLPADVWTVHNQILQEVEGSFGCEIPAGLDATQGVTYPWWDNDNADIFEQYIWTFRSWMADRGYRDCELIVSEYGVLYPAVWFDWLEGYEGAGDDRTAAFMEETYRFMLSARSDELGCPDDDYRLVQRWMWYSLAHPAWEQDATDGMNGALCDPDTYQLRPLGEYYADMVPRLIAEYGP